MWMLQPADMDNVVLVDGSDMDIVSFDDSEQFEEEDSVCSWISDGDQILNWSGWKTSSPALLDMDGKECQESEQVLSLIELSSRCVARNYAFEVVENYKPPIPEGIQLRIAFWSFPENEDEIRLYSCLACGSNDKFKLGDVLAKSGNVRDVLQIGFHLSGVVTQPVSHTPAKQVYNVAISFDRGHITSCQCTCRDNATWCEHATAVCLYRIFHRNEISLRAPVSESLTRLERDQLQKFAQYLISELPQQILPTAQRLLDELLSSKQSTINVVDGAPDPTAGASISEEAKWVLDELSLRENIKKILGRFCGVLPLVVVDVNSAFLTSAPPVSLEWSSFIRSFQSCDPEAIWNLLSIVRHMFARGDSNATNLLHCISEECLVCYQMMYYWLSSYESLQGNNGLRYRQDNMHSSLQSTNDMSRHASSHLMEEVVHLWELAAMAPHLEGKEKSEMKVKFHTWTAQVVDAAKKGRGQGSMSSAESRIFREFSGFSIAMKACEIDWNVFYDMLSISKKSINELSVKARSMKLDETRSINMEKIYSDIVTVIPQGMDESQLVNKLTQALCCHGFINKASKLASILAKKIISSYPERMNCGETNFSSITEKANNLCDMVMKCSENGKVAFEIAILGLTVPRLPAQTNIEEVRLSYLEMALYEKLKSIIITDERLNFIRYQAQKFLANPMLRGDGVLAFIMATYIFEVLCGENVASTVLRGGDVYFAEHCRIVVDDNKLGYKCALVSLGLCSNAVDQKQPMLCESIRHHRRDLALSLLTHCRREEQKVAEVLAVILDKDRYSFMSPNHTSQNTGAWINVQETNKKNKKKVGAEQKKGVSQNKAGFTFADIRANIDAVRNNSPERAPPKHSSDSDSGNGEGGGKRFLERNLPVPITTNRKTQHQRRQSRQNNSKTRADNKNTRNERPWVKHNKPNNRTRKTFKNKTTREMTESDSGQEMHFSFEGEGCWPAQNENWDDELEASNATAVSQPSIVKDLPTTPQVMPDQSRTNTRDSSSGGGSSLSSLENIQAESLEASNNLESSNQYVEPDVSMQILLPGTVNIPGPDTGSNDNIDAGFDDDFNIVPDIFQRNDDVGIDSLSSSDVIISNTESLVDQKPAVFTDNVQDEKSNEFTGHVVQDEKSCEFAGDVLVQDEALPVSNISNAGAVDSSMVLSSYVPNVVTNDDVLDVNDGNQNKAIENIEDIDEGKVIHGFQNINLDEERNAIEDFRSEDETTSPCIQTITQGVSSVLSNLPTHGVNGVLSNLPMQGVNVILPNLPTEGVSSVLSKSTLRDLKSNIPVKKSPPLLQHRSCESLSNESSSLSNSSSIDSGADQLGGTELNVGNPILMNIDQNEGILSEDTNIQPKETRKSKKIIDLDDLHAALQSVQVPPAQMHSQPSKSPQGNPLSSPPSSVKTQASEQHATKSRKNKQKKNKKTKVKVSMNIQSIEAEAYSLFELAKSVLLQARNSAIFSADADEVNTTNSINRRLQLAAFEIGLFALNMHNYSSPNWFSRTYSSYVSWIENQAIDIGTPALRVLNERWEGILTPSESIQIATRASRSGDSLLKRTSAELALSCLCYSQSLSPGDITQTITMCREQDNDMLERACSAVENAGRNGGVQPELFFRIAREWHYLHEDTRQRDENEENQNARSRNPRPQPPSMINRGEVNINNRGEVDAPVYMTPEQFVQEQMHQQAQEMLGRQLPRVSSQDQFAWIYPPFYGALHHCPLPQQAIHSRRIQNIDSYNPPLSNFPDELNLSDIPRYLQNAYRVGMRALEALTLRMPDDRPDVKYALAPPSSQDIRWMCALAASLGPPYLKNFCKIVYNAVTSPYLLHDLALEAARHFALFNPAQLASYLRSPSVSPIVQKALSMYTELVHHDLVLLGSPGYADFVDLLRRTRSAFCMAPGGMARFNEVLEVVRKTYPKKRELWQLIMNGLSKA